jgi:hypothetical protein
MKNKLNLGCGTDIMPGHVNMDKLRLPGVNIVHDLNKFPYPFKDNQFDTVFCRSEERRVGKEC